MVVEDMRAKYILIPALVVAIVAHGGDQETKKKAAPQAQQKAQDLIWPLPPDPPRVKWLAEYRDLAKIKPSTKKSGWVERMTGTKTPDEKVELRKPYGVATDSHGRIYVADTELKLVWVIDPVNRQVSRREPSTRAPLALPAGVSLDSQDRLFVSDAALHTIVVFSPEGEAIAHFGTSSLGRPGGIAIDRRRNLLYVADAKESRIAVFNTQTFEFSHFIGGPSNTAKPENGRFNAPTNVAVDRNGNVYVADTWNYRVQILDSTGKFVRAFGAQGDRPGEFIRPKGIAVDSEGHIYVADAEFNNFQILTPEGQPLLAVGILGDAPGQFALLAGLYIDSNDRIYTTEQFRGRVQVFQYISHPGSAESKGVTRPANP
jgi:DNA-binding beta-propeller fold protein YncE